MIYTDGDESRFGGFSAFLSIQNKPVHHHGGGRVREVRVTMCVRREGKNNVASIRCMGK